MTGAPVKKPAPAAAAVQTNKKSGMRTFKQGETIFKKDDPADSLFIIQKGQIRLFLPKGRGFVELAILRTGEVIGEMGYFDEKATRRSCSAEALTTVEVIEISYLAFAKTMEGLNPWFKTIINTLADRLRKTNDKVKQLESNSVGISSGDKVGSYTFFNNADVLKLISLTYMCFKTHGVKGENGKWELHQSKLRFYMIDIFNMSEVKFEEFLLLLSTENFVEIALDADKLPKLIRMSDVETLRSIMVFINTQRILEDSKKIRIGHKCERFLKKMLEQFAASGVTEDRTVCNVSAILDDFAQKSIPITDQDLGDAIAAKLCDDIVVGELNQLTCNVEVAKLRQIYPSIRLTNAIARVNEMKASK